MKETTKKAKEEELEGAMQGSRIKRERLNANKEGRKKRRVEN